MRKLACVLALLVVLAVRSRAATLTFIATGPAAPGLSPLNENPPHPESSGTGTSVVTWDTATNIMTVSVVFNGLTTPDTAAHIHCCVSPPGNAGVATQVPFFAGFPIGVTSGTYVQTFDMLNAASYNPAFVTANGGTAASAAAALLAGIQTGQAYLNIHTMMFPGGEIRGFLAVPAAPTISKAFGATVIAVGQTTSLTFTVTNPNATVSLTGVAFNDVLPAGLVVATPNGLNGTGPCSGGTVSATPGSHVVTVAGGIVPAGATCTLSLNVTATTEGMKVNTTSAVTSIEGGTGNVATATLNVVSAFEISYASNLNLGDSVIDISNTGQNGASLAAGTTAATTGAICANVYAFSPDEQLIDCCSCPVTPNGLVSLSARKDIISNPLTPAVPNSIVIKLYASQPVGGSCVRSAAFPGAPAPGLAAWGTTVHAAPASATAVTENAFRPANLSNGELTRITTLCNFIQANGSGFGICNACRLGGLGADRQ